MPVSFAARVNKTAKEASAEIRLQNARATMRMVRAAAWHGPYHATCLPQSITLWWLLLRQGIESDLRFGARKEEGQLEAHAWVEFKGLPLNETERVRQRFAAFDRSIIPAGGNTQ